MDSLDIYDDRAAGGTVHSTLSSPSGGAAHVDRLNALLQRVSTMGSLEEEASLDMTGRGLYRKRRPAESAATSSVQTAATRQGMIPPAPTVAAIFRFDSPDINSPKEDPGLSALNHQPGPPAVVGDKSALQKPVGGQLNGVGTRAHGSSLYKNAMLSRKPSPN